MIVNESLDSFLSADAINEERDEMGRRPRIKSNLVASAADGGKSYKKNPMNRPTPTMDAGVKNKPILKKQPMGNPTESIVVKWEEMLGRPLKEFEKMALTMSPEEQKSLSITKQVYLKDAIEQLKSEKLHNDMMRKMKEDPNGYKKQI